MVFRANNKVDDYEIFGKVFDKLLKISTNPKRKRNGSGLTTVTLDGENYGKLVGWLGKYITFVDQYSVNKLVGDIQSQLKLQAEEMKEQIATLRVVASKKHQDRVA